MQRRGEVTGSIALEADFSKPMELRLRLEPQLVQLAALHAPTDDIARMEQC